MYVYNHADHVAQCAAIAVREYSYGHIISTPREMCVHE